MIVEKHLKKLGFELLPDPLESNKLCWSLWDEELELFGKPFKYKIIKFDVSNQIAKACYGFHGQSKIKCDSIKDLKQFLKCITFLREKSKNAYK